MKLSPLTKENCEEARQWRNEDIAAYRTPFLLTEEMQQDFYRDVACNRLSNHRYWAIWADGKDGETPANRLAGMGGLTNIQWENSLVEISLVIRPDWQGIGYGEKAVELLLDQAFNCLNLKTVCGECYICNRDAHTFWMGITERYMSNEKPAKTGYTYLWNRKFWSGSYYSSLYFSIDADDFRKIHSPVQPT